jgi:hypothetical protein
MTSDVFGEPMNEQLRQLHTLTHLGEAATAFLQSDLGRYLQERAEAEMNDALLELMATDPTASEVLRQIQSDYAIASAALSWLTEAIDDGHSALQALNAAEY